MEKLRITWWATYWSLQKAICSNYQKVMIILCICVDKILNTSSEKISTIPSQVTFSLKGNIKELENACSPSSGGSDL